MKIFYIITFIFLLIISVIGIVFVYFFIIPPHIVSISPIERSSGVSLNSPIIIKFDKPIGRQQIIHSVIPEVYGEWSFEDPLIGGHLFRTLIFTPEIDFKTDTEYYFKLENIIAPLSLGRGDWFLFSFRTKSPSVNLTSVMVMYISKFVGLFFHDAVDEKVAVVDKSEGSLKPETNIASNIKPLNINNTSEPILNIIKVSFHWQESPLSCEAASLKMALSAKGLNVSENDIMQKIGYDTTPHIGNQWGNPNIAFVGNINGNMCTTGYGVYWGPVARAANYWRPAEDFSGWSIQQLTAEINLGNPVMFWGVLPTGKLVDCSWYTQTGEYIRAFQEDHVRLVVGFIGSADNPSKIIIKDPLSGDLYWSTSQFLTNWNIYGNSGVVIR